MTPLPSRRVWMTNVLTGISRERYRFYVNETLVFRCHGHPWDNTPTYSLHRKLAIQKLYKVLVRKNATAKHFLEKQVG